MNQGTILDNTYEILEEIGEGSGGKVFRAYHKRLQKMVVLKKISDAAKNVLDNRTETDILKNLRHSYLPQVLDFLELDQDIYTVMDYIPGESFAQLMSEETHFTQKQVVKYAKQMCEALCYLHTQNPPIIHGDIKPANIMRTPEDNICLIDFNVSNFLQNHTSQVMACTPGYASPEQYYSFQFRKELDKTEIIDQTNNEEATLILDENMSKAKNVDARSDIYSVGATLYHIITGRRPESDCSKNTPLINLDCGISSTFAAIIDKAMQPEQENRFQSAEEMLQTLNGLAKLDKRYTQMIRMQHIISGICVGMIVFSIAMIFFGKETMAVEKQNQYEEYIVDLQEFREEKDNSSFETLYEMCVSMFPRRMDAYYQRALLLYESGDYESDIEYVFQKGLSGEVEGIPAETGNMYYILANCYIELEDYENAMLYYETAIQYNEENPNFYRDYAIALAKNGEADKAKGILETAKKKGLLEDSIYLATGEIENTLGNEQAAKEDFQKTIEITQDDYIKFRAYIMLSKLYGAKKEDEESLNQNIELLNKAKAELPPENQALICERLVQGYIDLNASTELNGYLEQALTELTEIVNNDWDTYNTHNNIAVIREKLKDFVGAEEELQQMLTDYGDNYNTYKRLAMVEAEKQNELAQKSRNYQVFASYYEMAVKLFDDSGKTSDSDMEMAVLEQTYEQVKAGNWLSNN